MKACCFLSFPVCLSIPVNHSRVTWRVRGGFSTGKSAFFLQAMGFAAACLLALQQNTLAQSPAYSISTLAAWDGYTGITGFSDSGTSNVLASFMSVGETFRINNGNAAISTFAFSVQSSNPRFLPGPSDFQVGVAAWNGSRPTGLLYLSDHLVASGGNWQNFEVKPVNLILNQGQEYLLFFTAVNFIDGLDSQAGISYAPNHPYADGQYCFLGYGGAGVGMNDLFSNDWTVTNEDLAFEIDYQVVPEPCSMVLLGLGAACFMFRRKGCSH
jgi:hypothetical protein